MNFILLIPHTFLSYIKFVNILPPPHKKIKIPPSFNLSKFSPSQKGGGRNGQLASV